MKFTDDEQISLPGRQATRKLILISSISLFIISLFLHSHCTDNGCRFSIEAFLIGWLAMFGSGAAVSWLANVFLITGWILIQKGKKIAWLFGLLAVLLSLYFLRFDTIIENAAGDDHPILKVGLGYWFWVGSCVAMFLGAVILRVRRG